ncbi:MAG: hypothetical protein V4592_08345 [Bacteroidota bacterium]
MKKKILIGTIVVLIFINLPFWSFITIRNYSYQNKDGSYRDTEMSGMGGSFDAVLRGYGGFLALHPDRDKGDNNLYRTFAIEPWRFWEWREMILRSDRFKLPYLAP